MTVSQESKQEKKERDERKRRRSDEYQEECQVQSRQGANQGEG